MWPRATAPRGNNQGWRFPRALRHNLGMSSILDLITNRIDRLRAAPQEAKRPARKAVAEPVQAPEPAQPAEPLTMAGLIAALGKLAEERDRQNAIVLGAEAERDRIMDDENGDDAELLEIDRQVALARLALDRLGRLEEQAYNELAPLQLAEQQRRWAHARDQYVGLMRDVHAAMEAYERAANRLWSYRSPLFNPVGAPGWDDVVPRLPHFAKAVAGRGGMVVYDSHQYKNEADRFANLMVGRPSLANDLSERMTRYIEGKLDLADLALPSSAWGSQGEDLAEHPVLVRLSRPITLPEGEVLALGTVVKVRAANARQLVTANRGVLNDTLMKLSGFRPVGADLQLREIPVPVPRPGA